MASARDFFTKEEEDRIMGAIQQAERNTSGEIRVHLENHCPGDPAKRAKGVFKKLGMTETQLRNGVLFYLAAKSRKFAVLGDEGSDRAVGQSFWDETVAGMEKRFKRAEFAEGLCEGILAAGENLRRYFPYQSDDVNELSDEISFEE